MTTAWATRLERQMLERLRHSDEEDPRYTEFLDGASTTGVLAKVFGIQRLSQLAVSAPIQLAAASRLPRSARRWLFPAGIAVMVTGAVLEAVGDHQKAQFRQRDDEAKPDILDTGLWGWSRHPNYFDDSMNYLLIVATGAKRTEACMQERPGYRDYQQRVSFFFPWPKKK